MICIAEDAKHFGKLIRARVQEHQPLTIYNVKEYNVKYFSGFFVGMLVGVAVGFLFAPSSGEELRAQIQQEAEKEMQKIEAEWRKRLQQVQSSIDETRSEMKEAIGKSGSKEAAEA